MMTTTQRLLSIGGAALAALSLTVASATATNLYFDDGSKMFTDASGGVGSTELFEFGFGGGIWTKEIIAPSSNTMALLVATGDANTGGHGLSLHVDYPFTNTAHGAYVEGNVLRLSGWIASDAGAPVNRQDWQFAILKIEFHDADLGSQRIWETDQDHVTAPPVGPLVTSYTNQLSTTEWTQFVFEYEYDTNDFSAATLEEVRGVIIQGDFETKDFNGNVVVDNVRMEIFADQAAADASPVDMTNPGPLPAAFAFYDIFVESELVSATVVEWDSQLGVQYQFEYSDDAGTTWVNTGLGPLTGDGTRMQVTDPAGPTLGRTYRISTPPPVPLGP
jgi:hypothetical protein